jgi:predicted extracellular nuclease
VYPQVNVGDTTPLVVGALSYDFGNFRIFPTSLPQFASGALARTTSTVTAGDDRLRIASYNVENLDPNDGDICDGAPDRDIQSARFFREAQQIVANLASPDLLGIEELQDNSGCTDDGTVDATFTLKMLVKAIFAAGGPSYSYVLVDPANNQDGGVPGGNIRQAILYNAARVSLVAGTAGAGNATSATALSVDATGNLQLSLSPGRIDPLNPAWTSSRKPLAATFNFNGRRVLVIVNHFNSKGGDEPLFGRFQPPVLGSATQRVQQATVVHDFVQQALDLDANARVICLGDFNDFEFSEPMRALTGASSWRADPHRSRDGVARAGGALQLRLRRQFAGTGSHLRDALASAWRAIPTDTHQRRVRGSGERSRSARCFAAHPASAARCRCRPDCFPGDTAVTLEGGGRSPPSPCATPR